MIIRKARGTDAVDLKILYFDYLYKEDVLTYNK